MTSRHSSALMVSAGLYIGLMPAQAIRPSSRPQRRRALPTAASTEQLSVTEPSTSSRSAPAPRSSVPSPARLSSERACSRSRAPAAASRRAMAAPIPPLAPVTHITFPLTENGESGPAAGKTEGIEVTVMPGSYSVDSLEDGQQAGSVSRSTSDGCFGNPGPCRDGLRRRLFPDDEQRDGGGQEDETANDEHLGQLPESFGRRVDPASGKRDQDVAAGNLEP